MSITKEQMLNILNLVYERYYNEIDFSSSFFGCCSVNRKILKLINKEYDISLKSHEMELLFKNGVNLIIDDMFCYCGNRKDIKLKNCSRKCASNNPNFREACKKTLLERYGAENYNNPEKYKKTCLEKYGVENPFQSEEILKKSRQTKLEKYGDQFYFDSEKRKQTNLKKYNAEHFNNPEKAKKTKLKKYGNENYNNRELCKQTCLEKYGVENVFQSEQIKEKIRDINIERYGTYNVYMRHIENIDNLNEEFVKGHFLKDGYFLLEEFCQYFNLSICYYYSKIKDRFNINEPIKSNKHKTQTEIYNWLLTITDNVIINNKQIIKPLELDIYLPDHNLAIEYDGLMYHSFGKDSWSVFNNYQDESENKYKHLFKTEECEKQGIQLLHIFENEWIDPIKQNIWKSVIKSKLGLNNRIYARKCEVKEITYQESNEFIKTNHLQGKCNSSIQIGLFYEGQLVSVMTFGKPRFNQNYQFEILRFCNKCFVNVIGAFSKILKYFERVYKYESIISYANRRWSTGNVYFKNNFEQFNISKPNYFYFKRKDFVLFSRQKFQKHLLKERLETFDENLTETENMYNNGFRKVYDCGQICFLQKK
jgi:hypothetical protein